MQIKTKTMAYHMLNNVFIPGEYKIGVIPGMSGFKGGEVFG